MPRHGNYPRSELQHKTQTKRASGNGTIILPDLKPFEHILFRPAASNLYPPQGSDI